MSANRLEFHGDSSFRANFGQSPSVRCIPLPHVVGEGHSERVQIGLTCSRGNLSVELCRAVAVELARKLSEAIAALPYPSSLPDVSGSVWGGE